MKEVMPVKIPHTCLEVNLDVNLDVLNDVSIYFVGEVVGCSDMIA